MNIQFNSIQFKWALLARENIVTAVIFSLIGTKTACVPQNDIKHPYCFSSLLLSQQFTNVAAVFAHCCISPSRNGSFSSLVMFTNSLWVCTNCGRYVSLMSWYSGQVVRKCSSVSTAFCVQWVHSLSSLGRGVCLWRPFSIARLWSLSLSMLS